MAPSRCLRKVYLVCRWNLSGAEYELERLESRRKKKKDDNLFNDQKYALLFLSTRT